jgi:hypothetical protein
MTTGSAMTSATMTYTLPAWPAPNVGWSGLVVCLLAAFVTVQNFLSGSDSFVYTATVFQASLASLILLKVLPPHRNWTMWIIAYLPYIALVGMGFDGTFPEALPFMIVGGLWFIVIMPAYRLSFVTVVLDEEGLKASSSFLLWHIREREVPYWDIADVGAVEETDKLRSRLPEEQHLTVEVRAFKTQFGKNDHTLGLNVPISQRDAFIAELKQRVAAAHADRARALSA